MKAHVDPDVCVGTGSCISICPEVFEMSEEGVAVAKGGEVAAEHEEACREAAGSCPVEAIKLEE
jgi:ferredoxin